MESCPVLSAACWALRALTLGRTEEIESDPTSIGQAVLVILLSSLAAGVGLTPLNPPGVVGVVIGTVAALLGWSAWAVVTFYLGTRLFPEPQTRADPGQLLRTIGFSTSPGLLSVCGAIPGLAGPVFVLVSAWMLVAMVVAVRQALDYTSTARAVAVCATGWLLSLIVGMVIGFFFSPVVH